MKKLIILLFILSFSAYSSDGAYDCSTEQRTIFNSLATKLIEATSYISKAEEMNSRGDRKVLLKQLNSAEYILTKFDKQYKDSKFCYSFSKQAKYLSLTSNKLRIKMKIHEQKVSFLNSCNFSMNNIKNSFKKYRNLASLPQKSYIEISKTLKRTNLLIESRTCNKEQKKSLYSLFDIQSKELEGLYQKITSIK